MDKMKLEEGIQNKNYRKMLRRYEANFEAFVCNFVQKKMENSWFFKIY